MVESSWEPAFARLPFARHRLKMRARHRPHLTDAVASTSWPRTSGLAGNMPRASAPDARVSDAVRPKRSTKKGERECVWSVSDTERSSEALGLSRKMVLFLELLLPHVHCGPHTPATSTSLTPAGGRIVAHDDGVVPARRTRSHRQERPRVSTSPSSVHSEGTPLKTKGVERAR